MVVLNSKSFVLPRVEKEKFIRLLRLGLKYNRDQGFFYISSFNNIEELIDIISGILKVDRVMFLQNCLICDKDFPCSDCKYADLCTTKNLPFQCVCPHCLKEGRTNQEYLEDNNDSLSG